MVAKDALRSFEITVFAVYCSEIQRLVIGDLRYEVVCIARYEALKCCRKASLKFVATRGAMFAARIMTCDRIVNSAPRAQNLSLLSRVFSSRLPGQSYALTEYSNFVRHPAFFRV
jgi:hypothetical protein